MEAEEVDEEPPHVMVVEDDAGLADLYTVWLEEFCTVRVANDCETAYEMFGEPFDVALLDRHLPDGTGDELLREIRALGLDWPVAMVTGEKPEMSALEMEFDEYICKPAPKEEIQTTVSRLVARANFEETITEYSRLFSKKELMEEHYSNAELASSSEYSSILEELEEYRYTLLDETNSFSGAEFHLEEGTSPVSCD